MSEEKWQRENWQPGGGQPSLFFAVYGLTDIPSSPVDGRIYRTRGLPKGITGRTLDRVNHADYLRKSFEEGYAFETFAQEDPDLARIVKASPGALLFVGEVDDASSLLYLRDLIGLTAWLLDHGGVAVCDPFTLKWWSPTAWKERFFDSDEPAPWRHVMVYYSVEPDGLWAHTRGILKFGRPDLSVRGADPRDLQTVVGLCNELIDFAASGGILGEGQILRHPVLSLFAVRHAGDRDDPDFNNVHVELERVKA
jgi:hypothetical protein